MGLGSKLNTKEIIGRFIAIEKRRLMPIEDRKEQKLQEVEAWAAVQAELQKLQDVADSLNKKEVWDAKHIESSNEDIITATGGANAQVGKTKILVESIALSHQITSQGYKSDNDVVGTGHLRLQVGEGEEDTPVFISISEENNTLEGIKNAINDSGGEVEAYIAKTYGEEPYRLLLTSKRSGEEGRIRVEVKLEKGESEGRSETSRF